jgi:hypothetical protein
MHVYIFSRVVSRKAHGTLDGAIGTCEVVPLHPMWIFSIFNVYFVSDFNLI